MGGIEVLKKTKTSHRRNVTPVTVKDLLRRKNSSLSQLLAAKAATKTATRSETCERKLLTGSVRSLDRISTMDQVTLEPNFSSFYRFYYGLIVEAVFNKYGFDPSNYAHRGSSEIEVNNFEEICRQRRFTERLNARRQPRSLHRWLHDPHRRLVTSASSRFRGERQTSRLSSRAASKNLTVFPQIVIDRPASGSADRRSLRTRNEKSGSSVMSHNFLMP